MYGSSEPVSGLQSCWEGAPRSTSLGASSLMHKPWSQSKTPPWKSSGDRITSPVFARAPTFRGCSRLRLPQMELLVCGLSTVMPLGSPHPAQTTPHAPLHLLLAERGIGTTGSFCIWNRRPDDEFLATANRRCAWRRPMGSSGWSSWGPRLISTIRRPNHCACISALELVDSTLAFLQSFTRRTNAPSDGSPHKNILFYLDFIGQK